MILLTVDEIIMLHDKLLKATGGLSGLRDRGLLESAVFSMDAGFEDVEKYPTVEEKAARLAYALVGNHVFIDENKRIGMLGMLAMLTLNEVALSYTQAELIQLGLGTASGEVQYDGILDWVKQHKKLKQRRMVPVSAFLDYFGMIDLRGRGLEHNAHASKKARYSTICTCPTAVRSALSKLIVRSGIIFLTICPPTEPASRLVRSPL